MPGGDIYCDRELSRDEVLAGLTAAFGISDREIMLVHGMSSDEFDWMALPGPIQEPLYCFASRWGVGDFFFDIDIGTSLGDPEASYIDRELVGRFCATVGCKGITSDDTANPYRWVLANEQGDLLTVNLDGLYDEEPPGMSVDWRHFHSYGHMTIDRQLDADTIATNIGAICGVPTEQIAVVFDSSNDREHLNRQPHLQLIVEHEPNTPDDGTFWLGLYRRSGYAWYPKAQRAEMWQTYGRAFAARTGCAVIASTDAY